MGWADIFFPGNADRREQLVRKNQELKNLMENNFRATNKLIKILNEHLGYCFCEITLNEKAEVKQNCDVLIERIHDIQAVVEKIDQELKDKLEPDLYEKLKRMDLSLNTSDHSKIAEAVCEVGGVAAGATVTWLMTSGKILQNIVLTHGLLKSTAVANIAIGVLFLGLDMIVEAIMGSIEHNQLESALIEYDTALAEFKPASEEYQDRIYDVIAEIRRIKKQFQILI